MEPKSNVFVAFVFTFIYSCNRKPNSISNANMNIWAGLKNCSLRVYCVHPVVAKDNTSELVMSDFVWRYKSFANLLKDDHNNFEYNNFKHALYGSNDQAQNGKKSYGSYNRGTNFRGNQDAQYHRGRRPDFLNLLNDSDEAYQDRVNADRINNYQGNNERKDYSHLDELERLSSCLVRLLGEARKEHGKLRKEFAFPTQRHTIQQPKRRIETNVSHAVPENFAEAQSGAAISPVSYIDENSESPLSVGMCNTSNSISEVDIILNDLHDLESHGGNLDDNLNYISPSLVQQQPVVNMNSDTTKSSNNGGAWNTNPVTSNSLLPEHRGTAKTILSPPSRGNHASSWENERKKKDSHNKVERKRRVHINKKIEELGSLLPSPEKTNCRQNKGSVLKATVEYIKQLRKDQERLGKLEERQSQNHLLLKKMLLRLQRLEAIMKLQSQNKGFPENTQEVATVVQPNIVNNVTIASQVKSAGSQQVPSEANVRGNKASDRDQQLALRSTLDFDDVIGSGDSLFLSPPGIYNILTEEAVNFSE